MYTIGAAHYCLISVLFFLFLVNGVMLDIGFRLIPLHIFSVLVFVFLLIVRRLKFVELTWIEIFFSSFLLFALFSSLYTFSHDFSLRFIMGVAVVAFCYFVTKSLCLNMTSVMHGAMNVAFSAFILLTLCLYFAGLLSADITAEHVDFYGVTIEKGIPRMIGLNNDPNICALASLIPLFFFLMKKGIIAKFFFFLSLFCVLATLSRGGLIAAVAGIVSCIIILSNKGRFHFLLITGILVTSMLIGALFSYDLIQPILEKRTSGISTGGGRFEVWMNAAKLISERPIHGYGIFTFREVLGNTYEIEKFAHNTYIEVFLETGIIGLFLFLLFIFSFLVNGYLVAKTSSNYSFLFPLNVGVSTALLGLSMYINPIFWFVILLNSLAALTLFRYKNCEI